MDGFTVTDTTRPLTKQQCNVTLGPSAVYCLGKRTVLPLGHFSYPARLGLELEVGLVGLE